MKIKESEMMTKSFETKKRTVEKERNGDTRCLLGTVPKGFGKKIGGSGNQRKNRHHPDHSIVRIS